MRQQTRASKEPAEKVVQDIRRATRKRCSAEEKIRIVLEDLRGDDSIAELAAARGSSRTFITAGGKTFSRRGKSDWLAIARAATSDEVKDCVARPARLRKSWPN